MGGGKFKPSGGAGSDEFRLCAPDFQALPKLRISSGLCCSIVGMAYCYWLMYYLDFVEKLEGSWKSKICAAFDMYYNLSAQHVEVQ